MKRNEAEDNTLCVAAAEVVVVILEAISIGVAVIWPQLPA